MEKRKPPAGAGRRGAILLLGLALLLASHLRPTVRVSVAGQELPGRYGLRQAELCAALARETAEEILGDGGGVPPVNTRLCWSLFAPDGDAAALTDALLQATPGVTVSEAVYVNGTRLGTVADGKALQLMLNRSIRWQMPLAAVKGNISGRLELRRVYTLAGRDTPDGDMVLLITGMAPVVYVDADGKLA